MRGQKHLALAVMGVAAGMWAGSARGSGVSDILGVTHIDGKSYFTNLDYPTEGANQVLATGSTGIKLEMDYYYKSKYQFNTPSWGTVNSLKTMAQTPYFTSVFNKPIDTYVITAYALGSGLGGDDAEYWLNGFTSANAQVEVQQFYDVAKYLMQTYKGTGKTFVFENWEGDWALRDANHDRKANPTQQQVNNMIAWFNARQAGINKARAELAGQTDVKVEQSVELNRVTDAMNPSFTTFTLANNVLPYTHVDMASYSSYDTEYNTGTGSTSFSTAVNYIASKLPSTAINGQSLKSVGIGEFGVPEDTRGSAAVWSVMNNVVPTVLNNQMPYAMYWEIISNELKTISGTTTSYTAPTNSDGTVNGYWMVKPDGTPGTAWHAYRQVLATNDPTRANTAEVQRMNGLHLAYASNFAANGATLGSNWTTNTSGGNVTVGISGGQLQMQVTNGTSTPVGQATLNVAGLLGHGLNPGDYVQFNLGRMNNAGVIGFSAFGTNAGSAIGSGVQSLSAWATPATATEGAPSGYTVPANPAPGWVPISFTSSGANATYDWSNATLGLRLDSADGNFATISCYLNGNYSGSWLYQTTSRTLDNFSLFAQANTNVGFTFNNVAIYTAGGNAASTAYQWDPGHTSSTAGGGSGTWDASTSAQFYNEAADTTWNNATVADSLVFGNTPGTVNVSGNVTASTLTFNSGGYTLSGGTVTMQGNQTINATSGNATINSVLAGNAGVTVTGAGTVTLGGNNTFTNGLFVTGGGTAVFLNDASGAYNLGAAGQPVILDGGTLSYRGTVSGGPTVTRPISFGAGGGTIDIPTPGTSGGKVTVNGTNVLTGSGAITKTGGGWLTIYGAQNETGNWTINGGVVEAGTPTAMGTGSVAVNAGGELSASNGPVISNAITLAGGTIGANNAAGTFSGPIQVTAASGVQLGNFWNTASQNVTISGKVAGSGSITVLPAQGTGTTTGTLKLTGDNAAFSGGFAVPTGTVAAGLSAGNTLGTGAIRLSGGKLALQGQLGPVGPAGAVSAVAVSGFNKDTIYANNEAGEYPSGNSTTNTLMDGNFSYFQNGFMPTAPSLNAYTTLSGGLPGTAISSAVGGTPFTFQSFNGPNTLQIAEHGTGSLTLTAPAAFTKLSILAASTWAANDTPLVRINFADGTSVTTTYKAYDWSIGSDTARQAASAFGAGGIDRYSPTQSPGWDTGAFGIYQSDIDLTNIGGVDYSTKAVASLTFNATNSDSLNRGATDIFAVSGSARSLGTAAGQSYGNAVAVSADSGIDVSGSLAASLGTLTIGSNKLSVTSADATASPYSLAFAGTSISGNASFDVAKSAGGGMGKVVLGAVSGSGSITKSNLGTLHISSAVNLGGSLTVNGGLVELGAGVGTSSVTGLSIAGSATGAALDLADNDLVLHHAAGVSPAETVRGYLLAGRAGGAWNGAGGIITSAGASDAGSRTAIGYGEASTVLGLSGAQTATWSGQAVDGNTLLLKYTWYGDANMDGRITEDDYALIDRGFAEHLTGWINGDFNYDGVVDASDYLLIDTTYGLQTGTLSPAFLAERQAQFGSAYVAALTAAVPEPSALAGLLVAGASLGMRRRSRR